MNDATRSGRAPAGSAAPRQVRAVEHAIDILDAIAVAGRSVGVSEISRKVGLSKASTHHLLATLESRHFVMRDPDSARFRLSWALYELGTNVVRSVDLSRLARPYLDRLAEQTGESTLLAIVDGDAVLYLDRGEAPTGLAMYADAGRRGPLHATASGKVLLAFNRDPGLVERILAEPLYRFTQSTQVDPTSLRKELADVRAKGYATCWQERELGLCSVAVPLHDHTGGVVAALTVAGPAARLSRRTYQAHLLPLRANAHRIEQHLGGARSSRPDVSADRADRVHGPGSAPRGV